MGYMQHVTEMPKPPIQYDPSVARQNPQAPPIPQIHIVNHEETDQLNAQMHNQMTAYQHREQRRSVSRSAESNSQYPMSSYEYPVDQQIGYGCDDGGYQQWHDQFNPQNNQSFGQWNQQQLAVDNLYP